ncbi:hypothetical protein KI387_020695 [Taxus chinensis]|uniref:Uncharacterized protein n=1 Tax=Taxus chinensis TaxID=29808 RepID=A0AA38G9G5_TAXCH|nr:hypothetical protein KI387_020695 [Taxus chinensis]
MDSRMVPNPLASRVAIVEETYVIYWCEKCFMPHAPCEEDQQQQEEVDDNDDDVCMMEIATSSPREATSTELIGARTVVIFGDYIHQVLLLPFSHTFEVDIVHAFEFPSNDFEYLRALMIEKYDGGVPSEEDRQLLMNVVVSQEKDHNTISKTTKGPQAKSKFTFLTKETPKKNASGRELVSPIKTYVPPHAKAENNLIPSDEFSNLSPSASLLKSIPYDIAQEEIIQGKDVNKVETPLTVVVLEKPQVLEELGEPPKVYLGSSLVKSQLNVDPFFTTLVIKDTLLHNCMVDYGASCNVMTLEVMNELNVKVIVAYGKCNAMDSREVLVAGCVKDLVM